MSWNQKLEMCCTRLGLSVQEGEAIRKLVQKGKSQPMIEALPRLLAADLQAALQQDPKPARLVLLFDTHESFWQESGDRQRAGDGYFQKDRWFRELLLRLHAIPQLVVVVAGRELPRWSEKGIKARVSPELLDVQDVEDFIEDDAREYLERAAISEPSLQASLLALARVGPDKIHPLYLGLSVDVVRAARQRGEELDSTKLAQEVEEQGKTATLIQRLFRYVDEPTAEAVRALAACRSFDLALYQHLQKHIAQVDLPEGIFKFLTRFSFVRLVDQANGSYRIHDLLRRLFDEQTEDVTQKAHHVLRVYYQEQNNIEFLYHLNRLDWQESVTFWLDIFEQAQRGSLYDLCRNLLNLREQFWVMGDSELGKLAQTEGEFCAALARYDRAEQKYKEAIAAYDRVLVQEPENIFTHNNRGITLSRLGDLQAGLAQEDLAFRSYQGALAEFDQILQQAPDLSQVYNNWGNVVKSLGDQKDRLTQADLALTFYQAAIAAHNEALKRFPNDAYIHNNQGNVLRSLGDLQAHLAQEDALINYQAAIAACDEALKQSPDMIDAHNNRGNVFRNLGDLQARLARDDHALISYQAAIAAYDCALKYAPNYIQFLNNQGQALTHYGQFLEKLGGEDAAQTQYTRAIAICTHSLAQLPEQPDIQQLKEWLEQR
ncbi:tetratricopeptide repeat protein [Candidatus Cyanaurora vandensis]|uniref:tetratricopeptide repeat protein n=2 Tax=Candidatus Cyanaurora vandensis TaxID=2714958 RepID=UPI00257BF658|nr:tetratricopeptide repeat protein [Candidatus Cyanaurora vandensis]